MFVYVYAVTHTLVTHKVTGVLPGTVLSSAINVKTFLLTKGGGVYLQLTVNTET